MKCKPKAKLKKLTIDELSGVDKACQAPATVAIMKRGDDAGAVPKRPTERAAAVSFAKRQFLLSAVLGHTHLLDDLGGAESGYTSTENIPDEDASGCCTSCGEESCDCPSGYDAPSGYHSHPWVRQGDVIVIGMAEGHTHVVLDVATPESQYTDENPADTAAEADAADEGMTTDGGTPIGKSSPSGSDPSVKAMSDIAIAKRLAAVLKAAATLAPEHVAYLSSLAGDDEREAFLSKSAADRAAIVKAHLEADPVVYTTTDGTTIRKSAGDLAVVLAKRGDAQAAQLEAQRVELAKAAAETERVTLEKRADADIPQFGGDLKVRAAIVKAIDGIADEALRTEAHKALRGANAALLDLTKARGVDPETGAARGVGSSDPNVAMNALEKGLVAFCKAQRIEKNVWTDGLAAFVATDEGKALKAAYDQAVVG